MRGKGEIPFRCPSAFLLFSLHTIPRNGMYSQTGRDHSAVEIEPQNLSVWVTKGDLTQTLPRDFERYGE